MLAFIVILFIAWFSSSDGTPCEPDCVYKACHKTKHDKLNIHLVPHTHDDAGWLKTVDQYYYGGNQRHAPFSVQHIIDSVLAELDINEDRRFVYVESSFLWRWWVDRTEKERERMVRLVREGRFQLLHGGWVMSDEATPHYSNLIDQMSFGLKFLKEIFGECGLPNVAWQIDPFGHSSEAGLQFADMGYDGVFFGRIDQSDYNNRRLLRTMEMVWRPDTSLGPSGDLFTGILYNLYMPPDGFCFDVFCTDEPIMDNPRFHGQNVEQRVQSFVYYARLWSSAYNTNNVMITMGGDFYYMVAGSWFINMDKIIKYANSRYSDINIIYSTPSCYLKALNDANVTWPVKDDDDFFPYSSYEGRYWTGYYTSRPTLKYMTYLTNNLLQVVKRMSIFIAETKKKELFEIAKAVALLQHHDGVSGTEKQHVADDYALYLNEAMGAGRKILTSSYQFWLGNHYPPHVFCPLLNISFCEETDRSNGFVVNIFNPLSRAVSVPVRIPVSIYGLVVTSESDVIDSELVPLPKELLSVPGRWASSTHDLLFFAEDIPPVGFKSFHVMAPLSHRKINATQKSEKVQDDDVIVDNGVIQIVMNATSGLMEYVIIDNETFYLKQNFYSYHSAYSYYAMLSGAYTFWPTNSTPVAFTERASFTVHRGKNIVEIHQKFNSWISQVIRMYNGSRRIEFQWLVGPINISNRVSVEVITRYETKLETGGTFYTDSNGRRFMKRKRNYRSSWNFNEDEGVASNYYPVTTAARINDSAASLTVLTDRPQGASSLQDGALEFMLHRRLITDDGKGVIEPLNEEAYGQGLVARGIHTLYFVKNSHRSHPLSTASVLHRLKAMEIAYAPWLSFSSTSLSAEHWSRKYSMRLQPILRFALPDNVNILTLENWGRNKLLLRVEHLFEKGEHAVFSKPVTISLQNLFAGFTIVDAVETNLAGNKKKECVKRMEWKYDGPISDPSPELPFENSSLTLTLRPMQIRTFILDVHFHN